MQADELFVEDLLSLRLYIKQIALLLGCNTAYYTRDGLNQLPVQLIENTSRKWHLFADDRAFILNYLPIGEMG